MAEQTVTQEDGGFAIERRFAAPVATVWEVWTRPEHFERWFGARPGTVELDARTGGRWQATVDTPAGELPLGGAYREVVERERIVWTIDMPGGPLVMTASFSGDGDATTAVYRQDVDDPASCEQAIAGATGILDRFEERLDEVAAARA